MLLGTRQSSVRPPVPCNLKSFDFLFPNHGEFEKYSFSKHSLEYLALLSSESISVNASDGKI